MLTGRPVTHHGSKRRLVPGMGVPVVFKHTMRGRRAWRDLIWTLLLVTCHVAIALGVVGANMPMRELSSDIPRFMHRWLDMSALTAPLLYLPIAGLCGAFTAPPASRFEETQGMLLTRLTPFDLCAGRLLAGLWPLVGALMASCALGLGVQVAWRPLPGTSSGYAAILILHLVLITALLSTGATGFLFAIRRRPGRNWGRGGGITLLVTALSLGGLFLFDPVVRQMENPTGIIDGLLLVNPATAATTALGMDVLRLPWIYERTIAPEYPFQYPSPLVSSALFASEALAALALASVILRRAYR